MISREEKDRVLESVNSYAGELGFSNWRDLVNTYPEQTFKHLAESTFSGDHRKLVSSIMELAFADEIPAEEN